MTIDRIEQRQQELETLVEKFKQLANALEHEEQPPKNSGMNQLMIRKRLDANMEHHEAKKQLAEKGYYIE